MVAGDLVRLQPVGPRADAHLERDAQLGVDGLHRRAHEVGDFVEFVQRDVEIEFVMHLQQDLGAKATAAQLLLEAYHSDLDEVGGRALQRGVDGVALGIAAHDGIGAVDVGQGASAA